MGTLRPRQQNSVKRGFIVKGPGNNVPIHVAPPGLRGCAPEAPCRPAKIVQALIDEVWHEGARNMAKDGRPLARLRPLVLWRRDCSTSAGATSHICARVVCRTMHGQGVRAKVT